MSERLKKILFVPGIIIIAGIIGYLLLVVVYCLPIDRIDDKVEQSCAIFKKESNYPRTMDRKNSQLDNYTDALMLLTASHHNNENVWKSAIKAEHYYVENKTPADALVYIYENQEAAINNESYARYWHGYLILLKPLLLFFNYGQIRTIIMCAELAMFTLLVFNLAKKKSQLIFPLFVTWIFMNPVSTMLSLQYNTVLMITFIAVLLVIKMSENWTAEESYAWSLLFLMLGILTSYFDLLTYPLVTLGIPLVSWAVFNITEGTVKNIYRVIQFSIFWGIGYGGMWIFKWILGSFITGENVIVDAINKILVRASSDVENITITYWSVLKEQLSSSFQITWVVLSVVAIVVFCRYLIKKITIKWNLLIILLSIALFPFGWYLVLKNHSYIHQWFTYREFAISIYAFLTFVMLHKGEKNDG